MRIGPHLRRAGGGPDQLFRRGLVRSGSPSRNHPPPFYESCMLTKSFGVDLAGSRDTFASPGG
jgi:hypothetical protein